MNTTIKRVLISVLFFWVMLGITGLRDEYAQSPQGGYNSPAQGGGSTSAGPINSINVQTLGAKGDAQTIVDGHWTGTGPTLLSTTAPWKSTDVGKFIFCNINGTNSWAITTIASYASAGSINLTAAATTSNGSSASCVWYTQDDTSYFQSAVTTAKNTFLAIQNGVFVNPTPPGIYIPCGGYVVSSTPLNLLVSSGQEAGISVTGCPSPQGSVIFPTPTFSSTITSGSQGIIVNGFGVGNSFTNFTIDGASMDISNTGGANIFAVQCFSCNVDRVNIFNIGSSTVGGAFYVGGNSIKMTNVIAQGSPTPAQLTACIVNAASGVEWRGWLCSNMLVNLTIKNETGASTGQKISFFGGTSDECETPSLGCTNLNSAIDVTFMGSTIWGSGSNPALYVDGTSVARLAQTFVAPYLTNSNGSGVKIASGGKVIATESQFGMSGTGSAVSGPSGALFQDVGGNAIEVCTTNPCTPITTANFGTQGFTGGINPVASLTHTFNTCHDTFATFTAATLCTNYADQNYQLIRITASSNVTTSCTVAPVVTITDGTNSGTLTITTGNSSWNSGALTTLPFTSGNTITTSVTGGTCVTPPTNFAVTYNMQSVLNY